MGKYKINWFIIGSGLGVTWGIIYDKLAIGIAFGVAVGLTLDVYIKSKEKKSNIRSIDE